MSVDPDSPWRGAAAAYRQPLDEDELGGIEALVSQVYYFNCRLGDRPLDDIIYRTGEADHDTTRQVYRWDSTGYQEVFTNGFEARREGNTPADTYFNLYDYVHHAGRPLQSTGTYAFISTTLDGSWRPRPALQEGQEMRVYRYEINAPGGICVSQTLGDLYQYPAQDEVCFIGAIAPQYIRSAQLFQVTREFGSRYPRWRRADDTLILNAYFNPQSHPYRALRLRLPVVDYRDQNAQRMRLKHKIYPEELREKRQALDGNDARERTPDADAVYDWYANRVEEIDCYINAAFRARSKNEAYLFMKNEYVLVDYAPGSTNDRIVNGPLFICDGFPSLIGTSFGEYGMDCAFDTDGTEGFIFSGKLCALIDYAPGTTNDRILQGPMTITAMFPFFKDTVFKNGIDAAFRATASYEAYLFKDDQYALINYNSKTKIAVRYINQGFNGLRGTIFESGIEAAFASHRRDEAYIFKGDQYALINFAPGSTNDCIIGGVKKIREHWPSLREILPRKNRGLDGHDHHDQAQGDPDQEL